VRHLTTAAVLAALGLGAPSALAAEPCGRTRFLTIYDSHGLTPFGDRLDGILLAVPGSELNSYTLGGANPGWLLRRPSTPRGYVFNSCDGRPILPRSRFPQRTVQTPPLADLLSVPEGSYDRQVVILTLGSNVPGLPAVLTPPVERTVRMINARPEAVCIWVGPPSLRDWSAGYSDQVYAAIREGIRAAGGTPGARPGPACHLVDSRAFSSYPAGGDGMHYGFSAAGTAAAHRWADGVGGEIARILRSLTSPAGP
jgi:hypothetical protein